MKNLTALQSLVFAAITTGTLTKSALCKQLNRSKGSIGSILGQLVKKGAVSITGDEITVINQKPSQPNNDKLSTYNPLIELESLLVAPDLLDDNSLICIVSPEFHAYTGLMFAVNTKNIPSHLEKTENLQAFIYDINAHINRDFTINNVLKYSKPFEYQGVTLDVCTDLNFKESREQFTSRLIKLLKQLSDRGFEHAALSEDLEDIVGFLAYYYTVDVTNIETSRYSVSYTLNGARYTIKCIIDGKKLISSHSA